MLNLFFLFLFLALSLPGFSQEETVQEPLSPQGGRVIIQKSPEAPAEEAVDPAAATINDDEDVKELEAARLKQLEKMKMIEATTKPLAEPVLNPLEEIKRLGHQQISAAVLMDDKVLAILQKTLKQGVMSNLSSEEMKKMLLEKFQGSFLGEIFTKFPKLLDIFADLLRDKNALPGLLNIVIRKEDMKTYGYICLALFIFGLFFKRRIVKPKWPFFKRFCYSMSVNLVLSSISLYLFYSYFSTEIGPTLDVILKHF